MTGKRNAGPLEAAIARAQTTNTDHADWKTSVAFVTRKLNEFRAMASDLRADAVPGTKGMEVWIDAQRAVTDLQTALSVLMTLD